MIGEVEGNKTSKAIPRNIFAVGVAQREVRSLSTVVREDSVPYNRCYAKAEEKQIINEEKQLKQPMAEEQIIDELGLSEISGPNYEGYEGDAFNGVFNEDLMDIPIEESLLKKYVVGLSKKHWG